MSNYSKTRTDMLNDLKELQKRINDALQHELSKKGMSMLNMFTSVEVANAIMKDTFLHSLYAYKQRAQEAEYAIRNLVKYNASDTLERIENEMK